MCLQKARTEWIKNGDHHTCYYHTKTINRRRRNKISSLKEANKNWVNNIEEMKTLILNYFKNLFTEENVGIKYFQTSISFPILDLSSSSLSMLTTVKLSFPWVP